MKSWYDLGIKLTGKGNQQKTICPKCSHTRKKKNDPCLSVNLTNGVYNCFHCGWTGNLKDRHYEKPAPVIELRKGLYSNELLFYFRKRGISEQTLKDAGVTEGIEFMPAEKKEVNTVQFNYYRNNELVNIKYRSGSKNFKLFKNAELIFYNLDSIKDEETCIVVEGEIDCLSFIEAGLTNVVSVPNGASKGQNLDYYNNCKHYFETKSRIYLATDNDEPGLLLRDELARRIGLDKCLVVKYPEHCKDANDVLKKFGTQALHDLITNARSLPVGDVIYAENTIEKLLEEFDNGTEHGTTTYFRSVDPHFTWHKGDITLFHGMPNHGKSKWVKQICLLKSINDGTKWAIFSPEEYPPTYFYSDLAHTYLGKNVHFKYANRCTKEEFLEAIDFVGKHFFYIYSETKNPTPEFINQKFYELICSEGIEGGIIDPFNQLDNNFAKFGRDDYYLSDFLTKEKHFALKHNFYKIIIAHPKGMRKNKNGSYDCPDAYDLHGGAMWNNKCDNIVAVHKPNWQTYMSTEVEINVQKIKKQAIVGIPGIINLNFDRVSNRYNEANGMSPFPLMKLYEQEKILS